MNQAEQIAARDEASALMARYARPVRLAARRAGIDVVVQNVDVLECVRFLASWDGPNVTDDDLVRYAVDWLSATP